MIKDIHLKERKICLDKGLSLKGFIQASGTCVSTPYYLKMSLVIWLIKKGLLDFFLKKYMLIDGV